MSSFQKLNDTRLPAAETMAVSHSQSLTGGGMISLVIPVPTLLLLLSLFPSVLCCLMMTNDTAGAGAENAVMAGKVASDTADRGALQTPSSLSGHRSPTGSH
jgi:hypothetical protein